MKTAMKSIGAALLGLVSVSAWANGADEALAAYQAAGAGQFSAERGATQWRREVVIGGQARSCTTCHGSDLTQPGKHARTGRPIKPLAPSANPQRLTDRREIEKWFLRNCKWTWGRECTGQEKGDFLTYLRLQ